MYDKEDRIITFTIEPQHYMPLQDGHRVLAVDELRGIDVIQLGLPFLRAYFIEF